MLDTGSFDTTVRLWDCKSPSTKPIQVLKESQDSVSSLHIIGHEIVIGSVDGNMRVYDLRMGVVYVDFIGRMFIIYILLPFTISLLHCQISNLFGKKFQNRSPQYNRREMVTQSWSPPWTRPSGSWTKQMGNYYRTTRDT